MGVGDPIFLLLCIHYISFLIFELFHLGGTRRYDTPSVQHWEGVNCIYWLYSKSHTKERRKNIYIINGEGYYLSHYQVSRCYIQAKYYYLLFHPQTAPKTSEYVPGSKNGAGGKVLYPSPYHTYVCTVAWGEFIGYPYFIHKQGATICWAFTSESTIWAMGGKFNTGVSVLIIMILILLNSLGC